MTAVVDDLRYPIGRFSPPPAPDAEARLRAIADIAALPARMRAAVDGLSDEQLDTRYRPQGWTVRQVVHHVADSHLNAFIRLKLALTEETPRITAYNEKAWADLADARLPTAVSLDLIASLAWTIGSSRVRSSIRSIPSRRRSTARRTCIAGIRAIMSRTSPGCGSVRGGKIPRWPTTAPTSATPSA
jgi:hypothetical protein